MTLHTQSIDEKLAAVEGLIPLYRQIGRATNDGGTYEALKAIAADLRARRDFPRSDAQRELHRALLQVNGMRGADGYNVDSLIYLAQALNNRWPLVSQALERFGNEVAESTANGGAPR